MSKVDDYIYSLYTYIAWRSGLEEPVTSPCTHDEHKGCTDCAIERAYEQVAEDFRGSIAEIAANDAISAHQERVDERAYYERMGESL